MPVFYENSRGGKKLRKWFWKQDGTVSVYFAIILAALVMFQTLLIDLARIQFAKKQSEDALKAGMRSVFSGYDERLQSYGLYGMSLDAQSQVNQLKEISKLNLPQANPDAFVFTDTSLVEADTRLVSLHSLANHTVFEHQLLEEMKYRAPIEFTRQLIDKFSKVKSNVHEAQQYTENADQLEKLINLRDQHMNHAEQLIEQLDRAYSMHYEQVKSWFNQISSLQSALSNVSLTDEEKKKTEEEDADPNLGSNILASKGSSIQTSIAQTRQAIRLSTTQHVQSFALIQATIHNVWNKAKLKDQELNHHIQSLKQSNTSSTSTGNDITTETTADPTFQILEHIPQYGTGYFEALNNELISILSQYGAFHNKVTAMTATELDNEVHYLKANPYFTERRTEGSVRRAKTEEVKQKKREEVQKAKEKMEEAKQQMKKLGCNADEDTKVFDKLTGEAGLKRKYDLANSSLNLGDGSLEADPNNALNHAPETSGTQTLKALNLVLGAIEQVRDEIYVNEYALSTFNYRTIEYDQLKTPKPMLRSEPMGHYLHKQEVEYILYGSSSCKVNLSAAYAEMFVFRMAIRTVEALLEPKLTELGSPWLVFLVALAQGAEKAYLDMNNLVEGKEVEVLTKLPTITLNYKDYLRLFLFMHWNHDTTLSRMQALIELNTGVDLTKASFYMQGEIKTTVKLWFIPGFIQMLNWGNALDGTVRETQYEMVARAAHSY